MVTGGKDSTSSSLIDGKAQSGITCDEKPAALEAFQLRPISPGRFYFVHGDSNGPTDRITCSVCFTRPDGRNYIAFGSPDGVWIGLRGHVRSLQRVLHLRNVTQCALLPESDLLLVLADKELWAYDIESMVPSSEMQYALSRARQKLNQRDAVWFRVGRWNDLTIVVYMTKSLFKSVLHVVEVGTVTGPRDLRYNPFTPWTEYRLPCEGYDVFFPSRDFFVILSARGFETMLMDRVATQIRVGIQLPVLDTQTYPSLQPIASRIRAAKSLGAFYIPGSNQSAKPRLLLCYDTFGLHVDVRGLLSCAGPGGSFIQAEEIFVEWQGTIERVACHPPYVLLFSAQFIAVRLLDSCELVQVFPTTNCRAIWDGMDWATMLSAPVSGASTPVIETSSPEACVHVTLREAGDKPRQEVLQVYELLPRLLDVATSIEDCRP